MHVVLVGVGASTARALRAHLEARGASVTRVPRHGSPSLDEASAIVLDLRSDPNPDAVSEWRQRGFGGPVIALARAPTAEITDVVIEPFEPSEVLERITLRVQPVVPLSDVLQLRDRTVDLEAHRVDLAGDSTPLRPLEVTLLRYLAERPGRVVSRAELLARVWGYAAAAKTRTVATTVARLRAKIEIDPSAPVHLCSVFGVGYRFDPVERSASPAPALTRFFGRTQELERLDALARSDTRILSVVGPGGAGKTRLVREWMGDADRPTAFCELAGTRTGADIRSEVGRVLQCSRARDLETAIVESLASKPGILILDNVEHLSDILPALLQNWATRAPRTLFVLTSRVVPSLPCDVILLDRLDPAGAESLFRDRVTAAGANLDGADPREIQGLLDDLDGLPLAIELVASRLRLLDIPTLRARLFDFKDSALKVAFEASWSLLEPEMRRALSQLAVFRGAFELEAAAAVLDADPLDALSALAEHSLVHRRGDRFALLNVIREHAGARAEDPGLRGRHAAWFARWGALDTREALLSSGRNAIIEAMEIDRDDLCFAADYAVRDGPLSLARDTLAAACTLLKERGPFANGKLLCELALAREDIDGDARAEWTRWAACFVRHLRTPDMEARSATALEAARATGCIAHIHDALHEVEATHQVTGHHGEAAAACREALEHATVLDDPRRISLCHAKLGHVAYYQRRYDEAAEHYEHRLAYVRSEGLTRAEGINMRNLAMVRSGQGRIDEAIAWARRAESLASDSDPILKLACTSLLGSMLGRMGDIATSEAYLESALRGYQQLGDVGNGALMGLKLADRAADRGQHRAAEEQYSAHLLTFRKIRNRRIVASALGQRGSLRARSCPESELPARFEELATDFREAISIHDEDDRAVDAAHLRALLAALALRAGRIEEAERLAAHVPADQDDSHRIGAMLAAHRGELETVEFHLSRLRDICCGHVQRAEDLALEARALRKLGRAGDANRALEALRQLIDQQSLSEHAVVLAALRDAEG